MRQAVTDPAPAKTKKSKRLEAPRRAHPEIAWKLLDDFNFWRSRCSAVQKQREQHRVNEVKPTDERLELLAKLDAWCEERRIDSRLWLFMCFRLRRWFYPPLLSEGELLAEKKREDYAQIKGLDAYRRRVLPQSNPRAWDPNRDTAPSVEAKKERLVGAGRAALCMALALEETLGYHPKSAVCVRCPVAPECCARLRAFADFDIMALRQGTITSDQARDEATRARDKQKLPRVP